MSTYLKPLPQDPGGHSHKDYDKYLYMEDVCLVAQNPCPPDQHHDYVLFFMLEKNWQEGTPQEDYCSVGSIDFDFALDPRVWSTRCPD